MTNDHTLVYYFTGNIRAYKNFGLFKEFENLFEFYISRVSHYAVVGNIQTPRY